MYFGSRVQYDIIDNNLIIIQKRCVIMNKLQNYLNDYVQKLDGDWSYLICNLQKPQETICLNEHLLHKSASMIKVLILATLCASDLDFNEKISIDYVPYVEGGGALQEMDSDTKVSIKALASLMIVLSDNLATNILIKKLGMNNIQNYADKLNLKQTKIQRYMMDFEASKQGRENYLTVNDYHKLLCHIYDNRHLLRFNIAWQILARQQFRDRIPYYWDENIVFHHKTGMLDFVEHDGGILEADFGTYSIIIFASNLKSNAIGGREMGKLGQYIYDYLAQK